MLNGHNTNAITMKKNSHHSKGSEYEYTLQMLCTTN